METRRGCSGRMVCTPAGSPLFLRPKEGLHRERMCMPIQCPQAVRAGFTAAARYFLFSERRRRPREQQSSKPKFLDFASVARAGPHQVGDSTHVAWCSSFFPFCRGMLWGVFTLVTLFCNADGPTNGVTEAMDCPQLHTPSEFWFKFGKILRVTISKPPPPRNVCASCPTLLQCLPFEFTSSPRTLQS